AVGLEVGEVGRDVAAGEDAAVDGWVERDDAVPEDLGEAGQALDARHLEPLLLEPRRRAAARDELRAELGEAAGELDDARLVVDRDQDAHRALTTSGSTRCSVAWIRCSSVARGSTGTGSWRSTGPVSTPSSTRCTVTPVVSTPAATASSIARRPGKSGRSDGWTLTIRCGKQARKAGVRRCM